MKITLVSPCYNEEKGLNQFIEIAENNLCQYYSLVTLLLVDDSSSDNTLEIIKSYTPINKNFEIIVLENYYNLGHQKAIRKGLEYAAQNTTSEHIAVLDSDGEDDIHAITQVMGQIKPGKIICFTRGKRHVSLTFKILYNIYQLFFKTITSLTLDFGNFCVFHRNNINKIASKKFAHFPAHVATCGIELIKIKVDRKPRISGQSKMNTKSLTIHGISAFIECSDYVLYRLIKSIFITTAIIISYICYVTYQYFFTNNSITGWTSTIIINGITLLIVMISFLIIFLHIIYLKNSQNE